MPLTGAQLAPLHALGRIERLVRGAVLALPEAVVAVVVAGRVRLFRRAAYVHDVTLALAGPGELAGAGHLFGDRSAENGLAAATAAEVLVVPAEAAECAFLASPQLYAAVARDLGSRALRVHAKLEAFSRSSLEVRVAAALLEIAASGGVPFPGGGLRLDLPLSQDDLARLAGTTRESCSATVAAFARRGLVDGGRLRGLVLRDPAALATLASVDFRQP